MSIEAEKGQELLIDLKKIDQDRLEKASVDIRRTEHSSLAEILIRMTESLFKRSSLEQCFTGGTLDIKLLIAFFMVMREELLAERIKRIKSEANSSSLAKACLTGNMDTINSALVVFGHKPPPDDTTTH